MAGKGEEGLRSSRVGVPSSLNPTNPVSRNLLKGLVRGIVMIALQLRDCIRVLGQVMRSSTHHAPG